MKQFLLGAAVTLFIGAGVLAAVNKPAPAQVVWDQPVPTERPIGAAASPDHYEYQQFFVGLGSSVYKTLTSGSSSSSPASLGSTSSGHFVVAASANTANASTTAITALTDKVLIEQETTTPIAGTTCNTAIASGTSVSLKVVSATSTNNGFVANVVPAPVTNPYCFSYFIVK